MMMELPPWYEDVMQQVIGFPISDQRARGVVARDVEKLASLFKNDGQERNMPAYLRKPAGRRAYFTYYTTANLLKLHAPLSELILSPRLPETWNVLDIGCGTGTGLLGLAAWMHARDSEGKSIPTVRYTACDVVRESLAFTATVERAVAAAWRSCFATFRTAHLDLRHPGDPEERYDLILGMNVLNELPAAVLPGLRHWLSSAVTERGFVMLIEPALRNTSRDLLFFRDVALLDGWTVFAPCLRQAGCPALENPGDWCHHDLPWTRPDFIAMLDEGLGHVKHSLKFSYMILNRHGETLSDILSDGDSFQRVVSELLVEKGRTMAYLCGRVGRRLHMKNRRETTYENVVFDELQRYDIVSLRDEETRTHDVRVGLESTVTKV